VETVIHQQISVSNGSERLEMLVEMQIEIRDFSQLHVQITPKSGFEFAPRNTEEFKFKQNLNSNLYREIPRNLSFSVLTS